MEKLIDIALDSDKARDIIISECCPHEFGLEDYVECSFYLNNKELCEECWNRYYEEFKPT